MKILKLLLFIVISVQLLYIFKEYGYISTLSQPTRTLEFIHIPKTGGSSIEQAASDVGITWGVCHWKKSTFIKGEGCRNPDWRSEHGRHIIKVNHKQEPWHTPPSLYFKPYQDKALFCVVRNPYDKYISDFYCPFRGVPIQKLEQLNRTLQIAVFNHRISRLLSHTMHNNSHAILQSTFVYNGTQQLIPHVLKFENLNEEFEHLMKQYDLPVQLKKHVNPGKKNSKRFGVQYMYPETIAIINRVAHDDFVHFGYETLPVKEWNGGDRIVLDSDRPIEFKSTRNKVIIEYK